MKRIRKHPRINLRFKDHYTMNEFEVAALQQGLSLPAWIKLVIEKELQNLKGEQPLKDIIAESILIVRKHIENKETEEEVNSVVDHVKTYIQKIRDYVSR